MSAISSALFRQSSEFKFIAFNNALLKFLTAFIRPNSSFFCSFTNIPLLLSKISGIAPLSKETTGVPQAKASATTKPYGSSQLGVHKLTLAFAMVLRSSV